MKLESTDSSYQTQFVEYLLSLLWQMTSSGVVRFDLKKTGWINLPKSCSDYSFTIITEANE